MSILRPPSAPPSESVRLKRGTRVSWVSIGVNLVLVFAKAAAGLLAGSMALVADAVHSLTDLISTAVVMIGLRIAAMPADESHPYGHHRVEAVATELVGLLLVLTALALAWSNSRLLLTALEARPAPGLLAVWGALGSVVVKEWLFRYTLRVGRAIHSAAVEADAWHHRSDALSSVAALLGVIGARMGWPSLDPLSGLVVAILILRTGLRLYWQSVTDLVDTAPADGVIEDVTGAAACVPGVNSVNDVKTRAYGPYYMVDLKICVAEAITVGEGHAVGKNTEMAIRRQFPQVRDVLVHINPCPRRPDDPASVCPRCTRALAVGPQADR